MERVFFIGQIRDEDELNKLSLALTDLEEVSHIKVAKNSITFNCARPESVQLLLDNLNYDYVLKEEINSKKRKYVAPEKKVEQIYMFTHLETEEEAQEIKNVLSKYSVYENVEVDFTNKLLKLTTSHKNAIVRINRLVEKVNPQIKVEQWKKPFKSQDLFNEKYLHKYIRIALLVVGIALGVVGKTDHGFLRGLGWLVALIVIGETTIKRALKDIKRKRYLTENVILVIACFAGWLYQAYEEALFVGVLYYVGNQICIRVMNWTMDKIDDLVNTPVMVRRRDNNEDTMVDVEDIDIGDTIVVRVGETIPLGGTIVSGKGKLDVYALNGSEILQDVEIGQEVFSGSVVEKGEIMVKVEYSYESSAMSKVVEIATMAPLTKSRTHQLIEKASVLYTRILVVLALICCTIIPLMNLHDNIHYLYLGAIMLTVSGSFAYKQGASFSVLAGIGKAFSKKIIIEENSGLDDLNLCQTIIYDRFDGVEVTQEELDLFEKIQNVHKNLIVFNDGPVDLENSQYNIYNNLSVEDKLKVMDEAKVMGEVAYIGDCDKDIALLQKAFVCISRGGVHDKKVIKNSDILLVDSTLETIIDLLNISRKQKHIIVENMILGVVVSLLIVICGVVQFMPWWLATVAYELEIILILLNTHRLIEY